MYDNHTVNSFDWQYGNNIKKFSASGNGIVFMYTDTKHDNKSYSFSVRFGNNISSDDIVLSARLRVWHDGWGNITGGVAYTFGYNDNGNNLISMSDALGNNNNKIDKTVDVKGESIKYNEVVNFKYKIKAGDGDNGTKVTSWGDYSSTEFTNDWNTYQGNGAIKALIWPFGK